jgi:hypothetical protein
MSNEVPGGRQVLERTALRFPFLDAVLTKMADAGLIGLTDGIRRVSLRNGNESNLFRRVACALGSGGNALPVRLAFSS